MSSLAVAYAARGDYIDAEKLDTQILAIRRRVRGAEHPLTIGSMANLAIDYFNLGKYAQAETTNRQVLELRQRLLGPDHAATLRTSYNLAATLHSEGKHAPAEELLRRNLAVYLKDKPDDWERFRSQSLLGAVLSAQHKYAEAEPLLLEGVRGLIQREASISWFGRSDPDHGLENLVRLYDSWGKRDKAAEWRSQIRTREAARNR